MDLSKIDVKLITENLVELLTNTLNISSLFEKVFYDPNPDGNITLEQYVYKPEIDKILPEVTYIPNVAYIKDELASHVGSKTKVLTQAEYDQEEIKSDVLYFITDTGAEPIEIAEEPAEE